jgi:2,4-diaminopentanoate dehydrogenase
VARLQERVRIGIVGLGWVGQEVARAAIEDPRVRLVGVADVDPAKANRDLGEILGEGRLGVPIDPDVVAMLARARPEVAVLTTTSVIENLLPTIEQCLANGAHVVTTCENLAAPELLEGEIARKLDERARQSGLVILATGVNPGFAMDRLPVMLSQATRNIRRVRVQRVVDAASRRAQLQAKAGIGMEKKRFLKAMNEGLVGHAGLTASLRLVAKGLGVTLDRVAETLRPLIADTPSRSSVLGKVDPGKVRGIYQIARGYRADAELITLELVIALDEPNARDTIDIIGEPPLHFQGELPGDTCTVATTLSAIPLMVTMQGGLRTVLDVPLEQPEEPPQEVPSSPPRTSVEMTLRPQKANAKTVVTAKKADGEAKKVEAKKPDAKKVDAKKVDAKKAEPKKKAKAEPSADAKNDGLKAKRRGREAKANDRKGPSPRKSSAKKPRSEGRR